MPKKDSYGAVHLSLTGHAADVLVGDEDAAEWDDEELWRGQRRNSKGFFQGRQPNLIPRQVLNEHHRRLTVEAVAKMREHAVDVVDYWLEVMRDSSRLDTVRLRASENLADRIWGKPREYVNLDIEGPKPYELLMESLMKKLDADTFVFGGGQQPTLVSGEVIDAQVIEADDIEDDIGGWDDADIVWDEAARYPMGKA